MGPTFRKKTIQKEESLPVLVLRWFPPLLGAGCGERNCGEKREGVRREELKERAAERRA